MSFKLYIVEKQNDSLKDKLSLEKNLHQNQISEILKRYDSVSRYVGQGNYASVEKVVAENVKAKHPEVLEKAIAKKVQLSAVNLNVRGVRMVGKDVVETNKSSKIDQLRICFTLQPNKLIPSGYKKIKVELINPKGRVIKNSGTSARLIKEIYYDQRPTDGCFFVNLYQHESLVGTYSVRLLEGEDVIASTSYKIN
ncbi:hypothetical protein [Flavobacterium sp.]|uniref:hypothetical protein n=1 Tax=Flavobacterium sp. TaxID=239 RepID=UPI0028BD9A7B|nr:hypothetical protein [Flavobacterium sp.]